MVRVENVGVERRFHWLCVFALALLYVGTVHLGDAVHSSYVFAVRCRSTAVVPDIPRETGDMLSHSFPTLIRNVTRAIVMTLCLSNVVNKLGTLFVVLIRPANLTSSDAHIHTVKFQLRPHLMVTLPLGDWIWPRMLGDCMGISKEDAHVSMCCLLAG